MGNYSNNLNFSARTYNIRSVEDWMENVDGEEDELEEVKSTLTKLVEDWELDDDTLIDKCMETIEEYLGSSIKEMAYHSFLIEDDTYEIVVAQIY